MSWFMRAMSKETTRFSHGLLPATASLPSIEPPAISTMSLAAMDAARTTVAGSAPRSKR